MFLRKYYIEGNLFYQKSTDIFKEIYDFCYEKKISSKIFKVFVDIIYIKISIE